jgi:VCBS repeat-containing protein
MGGTVCGSNILSYFFCNANNDYYTISEQDAEANSAAMMLLDVMANDSGNKISLYSIDDGSGLFDLLSKDGQYRLEDSELGATIWIQNGKIAYDFSSLLPRIAALAEGETLTDSLSYAIRNVLGDAADVQITFVGTNDAVMVQAAIDTGAVVEDSGNPLLATSGAIQFSDADLSDTHSASVAADAGNLLGGALTASVASDSTGTGNGTVTWSYAVDNSATQYLAADETLTEYFTVSIVDNHGSSISQQVAVTVTGTDDLSVVSGQTGGSVTEDALVASVSGKLDAVDVDGADDNFTAAAGNGSYGAYTVDAAGNWSYTLDNANAEVNALHTGESLTDSFAVVTADGVSQQVSITIDGQTDFLPAVYAGIDPNDFDATIGIGVTVINGTEGDDTFDQPNTTAPDVINGFGGDDRFFTYGGADQVYAGSGDDFIQVGGGGDGVYGQEGEDEVYGESNPDNLYGGSGNDIINGGAGDDIIFGGSGDDIIVGQGGDDFIVGGFGADTFVASLASNRDTFVYLDVRDTGDTFDDFRAMFTLDFSAIDADAGVAGDQAFLWGGETATAHGIWTSLNSSGGGNLYLDTDGDVSTAELALTFLVSGGSSMPVPLLDNVIL